MEYYSAVNYNLASKGTRFLNYIIDIVIFYIFIFTVYISIAVTGIADGFFEIIENNQLIDRLCTLFFYCLFMFGQETLLKGQSVGKLLTKTKVVYENGHEVTWQVLVRRNISRAVPFDQLSFFGNLGWHDRWSDTRVVNIKEFERDKEEVKEEESIELIGSQEQF